MEIWNVSILCVTPGRLAFYEVNGREQMAGWMENILIYTYCG